MRFFWLVFTGMFITILSIFIFNTTWNLSAILHKDSSNTVNPKAKSQNIIKTKTNGIKHKNNYENNILSDKENQSELNLSLDEPTKQMIHEKELPEDEQIYKEEIADADPEEVEIKNIKRPLTKHSMLSTLSATLVKMKIKAKEKNGMVKAKIGISHDMLTYAQAKKKGREANFITHIIGLVNKRVVYDASTSQFLSKNPLIKFSFQGKKGDILTIIYQDLKDKTFYASKKIR